MPKDFNEKIEKLAQKTLSDAEIEELRKKAEEEAKKVTEQRREREQGD